MGCVLSHPIHNGVASKGAKQLSRDPTRSASTGKHEEEEAEAFNQFIAGYISEYSQKGTVTTYEDYKGYMISATNHVSKDKLNRVCKWADAVLLERHRLNHDTFFNPENPNAWPREVVSEHISAPSFANRRTTHQTTHK
ncbi:hypothetical protein ABL78_0160 [Leptomonas seymouri]|uniref:Uncharacterized protein n=1 Tax=Leptomonas seymouri TaxID=5684 RepID=A0A0N1IMM7_LEPSE|nr:hypothetical protein ABL78_0160 [Leptomonas seymouri]|eukprot:KPI90724.1 hypothetical protein ABL78_0160 [Leptomonas seymouri]